MKYIELHQYRCFELLRLDFSDQVNLFIGDNASGKTTITRAVASVLSSFFTGFSDDYTRFIGLSKYDFRLHETEIGISVDKPIQIEFELLDVNSSLELNSKKGRTLGTPLYAIKNLGKNLLKTLEDRNYNRRELPILACFSTADIHTTRKINKREFIAYKHKPTFGYYECLQGDGFLDYWTYRLLVLKEGNEGATEIEGVISTLKKGLGQNGCNIISDISIRPIIKDVFFLLNDQRYTTTSNLSDGYKRLINIFMDISFRCMILNQAIYGVDACEKTSGTVIIDEIDLHLHPTLQSTIIKGLQLAFPKIQFIITTHSPMVMTGIRNDKNNKVVKLEYSVAKGYQANTVNTYGLDASTIINIVLGVEPRFKKVAEQLKELFNLIDDENYDDAKKKLAALKLEFTDGSLPELAKAETMLHFFTAKFND